MTNCVQKITVTQKFKTQPIYVNPEPDGSVTILDNSEVVEARKSYFGGTFDTLQERLMNDFNGVLDKVGTVNYKDTTIHANNTYARNLVANRNKVEVLGQTIQNCVDHSSADKFFRLDGTVDDSGYINVIANGNYKNFQVKSSSAVLKPSTQYTFIIDVKECSIEANGAILMVGWGDEQPFATSKLFNSLPVGITKFTVFTKDDLSQSQMIVSFVDQKVLSGSLKLRYAIIEGDWTNKEISFIPFGLNYPETTEVVEDNGLEPDNENYQKRVININKPLASVSDAIRDRYYVKDSKKYHEQNTKVIVLNGSENWSNADASETPDYTRAFIKIDDIVINSTDIKCDKVLVRTTEPHGNYDYIKNTNGDIYLQLAKNKLISPNTNGLKDWLTKNNIIVLYPLKEPITTEIETEDLQSFDGQTNITTTNTVKPTLDIDIPSDLNAVVSNLMVENTSLKQENQMLNDEVEKQKVDIEQAKANTDYISMMTGVDL